MPRILVVLFALETPFVNVKLGDNPLLNVFGEVLLNIVTPGVVMIPPFSNRTLYAREPIVLVVVKLEEMDTGATKVTFPPSVIATVGTLVKVVDDPMEVLLLLFKVN